MEKRPYRVHIHLLAEEQNLENFEELSLKFGLESSADSSAQESSFNKVNQNGYFILRYYVDGVFLMLFPPKGKGKEVSKEEILEKLRKQNIQEYNEASIEAILKEKKTKLLK